MKKLDLDTFGEMIDNFIKENEIQMLITLPEGSIKAEIKDNCQAGSVMHFYIVLNAIGSIADQMKKEMGIDGEAWEGVVDALLQLLKKDLLETQREGEESEQTSKEET